MLLSRRRRNETTDDVDLGFTVRDEVVSVVNEILGIFFIPARSAMYAFLRHDSIGHFRVLGRRYLSIHRGTPLCPIFGTTATHDIEVGFLYRASNRSNCPIADRT